MLGELSKVPIRHCRGVLVALAFLTLFDYTLNVLTLAGLTLAVGMLVDNAIVVVDGVLVRLQKGEDPERAASEVVAQSSLPLLGATTDRIC